MQNFNSNTKVFGLGLSKTGTTTLGDALNILGIKTIHYPYDNQTYQELSTGNYNLSICKEYQGVVDITTAPYYAQLDKIFPGSKYILTVREMESWLRSIKKHSEVMRMRTHKNPENKRFHEFIWAVVYGTLEYNEDRHRYVYETHEKNVLSYFSNRPQDLLIMDICGGDGWEKLCPFFNLATENAPFPHANQGLYLFLGIAKEIQEIIPPGNTFILIDEEIFGDDVSAGRTRVPFTEKDGDYWGLPVDAEAAIKEFERLAKKYEPQYLVFAQSSFWWLDYYADFYTYLSGNYNCIVKNNLVVIFDLRNIISPAH